MEKLEYNLSSKTNKLSKFGITAGVVNSGNLEILLEKHDRSDEFFIEINTTVPGFAAVWQAVIGDFVAKYDVGACKFTINDCGATPAVVSLRLRQLYEAAASDSQGNDYSDSRYLELNARQRINALVDDATFTEIMPASNKIVSPHLGQLDLPVEFDDGAIIGKAKIAGKSVYIASQNYAFMGGAVGEVNGAKLSGICLKALKDKVSAMIFLLDSGGVRLHEANAGEIAISELIAAIMQLKLASIPVIGIVAGRNGAFGGIGIVSQCLDAIIVTENARTSVSGPEVIETVMGVAEYDSSDRALVWRTCGGRHRSIMGDALYCSKQIFDIRQKLLKLLNNPTSFDEKSLLDEYQLLEQRLTDNQNSHDGTDVWTIAGLNNPQQIPDLSDSDFMELLK